MPALGPIIPASYGGECTNCLTEFYTGDDIRYLDGDLIGQDCCGEEQEAIQREERENVL